MKAFALFFFVLVLFASCDNDAPIYKDGYQVEAVSLTMVATALVDTMYDGTPFTHYEVVSSDTLSGIYYFTTGIMGTELSDYSNTQLCSNDKLQLHFSEGETIKGIWRVVQ